MPSQVTGDFKRFAAHNVSLVLLCELSEAHWDRPTLPDGWSKVSMGEFQLAAAPGWKIGQNRLRKVWPDADEQDRSFNKKHWREFFQAGIYIFVHTHMHMRAHAHAHAHAHGHIHIYK